MSQVFPDTPGVIYRLLSADPEFSDLLGTYRFSDGQVSDAISLLTPGQDIPGVEKVTGLECIIHDISDIQRIDFVNDSSILINKWKVFLVAWDPATGENVNNAARRIMALFRGATSTQTVRTSEGLTARVQTVVTIPSNQPLDIEGLAVYGPQPAIAISSDINYIEPGQEVELSWVVTSALRAEMDNGVGLIDLTGSRSFIVDKTTTFNITAYTDFTQTKNGFEVIVMDPVISFFDFSYTGSGDEYQVSWGTNYATEVRFNGRYDWPSSGSTIISVSTTTQFILEAYSPQGIATETITIDPFAPVLLSASTSEDGIKIVLTYDEPLSEITALPSNFDVLIDSLPVVIENVTVVGSTVELELAEPIQPGQDIQFSYNPPLLDYTDSNTAIQDIQGNDAEAVVDSEISNNTNP